MQRDPRSDVGPGSGGGGSDSPVGGTPSPVFVSGESGGEAALPDDDCTERGGAVGGVLLGAAAGLGFWLLIFFLLN